MNKNFVDLLPEFLSAMTNKTILILGGGIGGVVAARELRRHLGARHRIVVVERSAVCTFPPSYLWVMLGWRAPDAIRRPLSLLERYGIEVHQSTIREIDPERRIVRTDHESLAYDYLVVALGAELAPQVIPGLSQSAHSFYTLDQAVALGRVLPQCPAQAITILIGDLPYKCPPAPYEAALLLESYFSRRRRRVQINLFTPEQMPLAAAGEDAGRAIGEMFHHRGIGLHTARRITIIDPVTQELIFSENSREPYDLLIAVPPHRPPEVVREAHLTDESGWIPVDERTLRTRYPEVFALGDITSIPLAHGFALPKAGVFAAGQAEIVAGNIANELQGHPARGEFKGHGFCFLETGNGRAAYVNGNFYAKPSPAVTFHEPSVTYHWGKVVFEKYWLWRWL